jgi:hypothetical protein
MVDGDGGDTVDGGWSVDGGLFALMNTLTAKSKNRSQQIWA